MDDNSPATRDEPRRHEGATRIRREWVALGALLVSAAAYVAFSLHSLRGEIERDERVRLEQQAWVVEQLLDARLEATSNALAVLRADAPGLLAREDGVAQLNERMRVMVSIMSGVRTFLLVNADGVAVASNRTELIGLDFREGERYRAIRGRPDANVLYVSPPFTTPLGVWALSLGRAVLDDRGWFDGYVLAVIDPEYWKLLLSSTRHTPDTSTAIVHGGGKVVYRVPDPRGAVGMNLAGVPDSAFGRHVRSGRGNTFHRSVLRTTGNEALVVMQDIRPSSTPSDGLLIAAFSREVAAVFAPWRGELLERVFVLAGAAVVSGLGLLVFQRRRASTERLEADHEAERRRQEEELRESEAQLRLILEAARAGTWSWDARLGRIDWSGAMWDLHGLDREKQAPSWQAWRDSILPEDLEGIDSALSRAAERGTEFEVEYRVGGRGAPVRWLLSRGRAASGGRGEAIRQAGIVVDITDLKRAAAVLLEKTRLDALEEAVSTLPIGVAITELGADGEPRIVATNAAQQGMVGLAARPGASISRLPYRFFQPDRKTPIAPRDWPGPRAARTGTPTAMTELHSLLGDGTWRVVLATSVPIARNAPDSPRRAITVIVDVTAERASLEALRASEARYRDLVELSPNAVLVNRANRIEFVSRAALKLFGAERAEQLIGRTPFDLFHPDFHPRVRERVALLLSGSPALPFARNRIVRLDGTTRDVEVSGALFQDDRGSAIQVIVRDVTDDLRREEALRESEQRFRAIFEGATDGIVTAEPSTGRLISCNAAFSAMTGYPEEEICTLRFEDLHEPQDLPEVAAAFAAMAAGRMRATSGTRVRRKDGSVFLADIAAARVTRGDRNYLVGFFRDVTEHRKADADLIAAQAQLAHSQRMEGIGRLAGGVAHDFNNILSVILTCAGFALEGLEEGDPVREDVLEIEKGAKRAAALTHQLLAFSRRQVLQPVSMDLNQTLAGMEKMLRRIIGEDIDLVLALSPDLGTVRADPGQIEQVLMNLAVNARDAMPEGGLLTIETANVDLDEESASRHPGARPGPHVMMAITDSGVGMDESTRARIFEPFFTTKAPGQGSGLGLSTVYGIVKQSGGTIHVHSDLGKGTTFTIHLPREGSPAAPAARPPESAARSARGETILVVEDDEAMRGVIRRVLAGAGYDVLTAANGEEGLAAGEHHPRRIHLLLTDVVMPQMSGRVLAERLARVRPGMKVLYMSGYTDDAIVHHGVLHPGTRFIGKPFSQADLLAKVRDVLDDAEA